MFTNPSLMTRIAVGKLVGFIFGLLGFLFLILFYPQVDSFLGWGVLFWYTTVGAVIGVFGVFNRHPILKIPLPWWVRAPWVGAWMNFVLVFFAYEKFQALMVLMFGLNSGLTSPWWFVLEGAIVGFIIGWLATRFGGEGVEAAAADAA